MALPEGRVDQDFDEALTALFGESVRGLSPATIKPIEVSLAGRLRGLL